MLKTFSVAMIGFALPQALAAQTLVPDNVAPDVWALVGPTVQRDADNLGNNATFGVAVTTEGVVLVDPGGSWQGAAMIDAAIDTITDQPVTHVINTGGQDHRWLGNGYWQAQGAVVIASDAAVADQKDRGSMQMSGLSQLIGAEGLEGTAPSYADVTFETDYLLNVGGMRFDIMHRGPAHTPGDSFVWLADRSVMFTGDIVYVERILGVGAQSNVKSWIAAFEAMAAFEPAHVVPGHGQPTTPEQARADTYDYLVNLRRRIGDLIDAGGGIMEAPGVDQSGWTYLEQFDSLAGRNAQTTFEQMEWE